MRRKLTRGEMRFIVRVNIPKPIKHRRISFNEDLCTSIENTIRGKTPVRYLKVQIYKYFHTALADA